MRPQDNLLQRILYATDASAYRELPQGVLFPKSREELIEIVKWASENRVPLIPRAAGTSLAGQVVGNGVVVDVSRHLKKIIEINPEERWVIVEPGVVLDELNSELAKHNLFFGPETSTSNRCCIGGMVGNNSCGSHSLVYGSTRDHLLEAEVVLCDGSVALFKDLSKLEFASKQKLEGVEGDIYRFMHSMLSNELAMREIEENFPDKQVRRRNTGYALDEFAASSFNLCKILAGSEGTLAMITQVKLNLVPPPPKHRALLCAHCSALELAFQANLIALKHGPVAVELMDENILELSKSNIAQNKNRFFIVGEPAAILVIEFANESNEQLEQMLAIAEKELYQSNLVYYCTKVSSADASKVWELRKAGLGLLSSMSGDAKPVSVVEDTAVAPHRLPAYMAQFGAMLEKYSLSCVYHAHIGTGELHLRPVLNLKDCNHVALFREIARETALLVKRHRGSLSGEHGDGRLRGEFIPLMYGDYVYGLMKGVKGVFDPHSIFNPNKITDTPPMNTSLRYECDSTLREYKTFFDFSSQGGWLRAVEQCNGSGDCRKSADFAGTMCPSFRVTFKEEHSTRGRANVMRELLSRPLTERVFDQKEILESLDLCLSCKACKSECPSNVDMAAYKAEFLQQHYLVCGYPFRSSMISRMALFMSFGSRFPKLFNFFASNTFTSAAIKRLLRFAPERSLPLLSPKTLKQEAKRICKVQNRRRVYLFADEFTNFNDASVGKDFIELLIALGYQVIIPHHTESGRASISKGMLKRAASFAERNVILLRDIVNRDTPLVGIEPSAILSFRDEYPALVNEKLKKDAVKLASNTLLYDEFIMREFNRGFIKPSSFTSADAKIKLHGHCHQKSLASVEPSAQMLSIPQNYKVETLPTGCCGMAGSFGYEREHYKYSVEIGEQKLAPLVRETPLSEIISAPGTSCRQQIKDLTGRTALHPVTILREALISSCPEEPCL